MKKNNGESLLKLISKNLILSAHDVSSGGIILALSEMAITSNYGIKMQKPKKLTNIFEYFFGEDQGRYILEIESNKLRKTEKILTENKVFFENIGFTQKDYFEIDGEFKTSVKDLFKVNNEWYNKY